MWLDHVIVMCFLYCHTHNTPVLSHTHTLSRYEKRRVLIRSGHLPLYCYFLFSGSVFVNIQEEDKSSGKKYYRTAAVLKQGTVFGVSVCVCLCVSACICAGYMCGNIQIAMYYPPPFPVCAGDRCNPQDASHCHHFSQREH